MCVWPLYERSIGVKVSVQGGQREGLGRTSGLGGMKASVQDAQSVQAKCANWSERPTGSSAGCPKFKQEA